MRRAAHVVRGSRPTFLMLLMCFCVATSQIPIYYIYNNNNNNNTYLLEESCTFFSMKY